MERATICQLIIATCLVNTTVLYSGQSCLIRYGPLDTLPSRSGEQASKKVAFVWTADRSKEFYAEYPRVAADQNELVDKCKELLEGVRFLNLVKDPYPGKKLSNQLKYAAIVYEMAKATWVIQARSHQIVRKYYTSLELAQKFFPLLEQHCCQARKAVKKAYEVALTAHEDIDDQQKIVKEAELALDKMVEKDLPATAEELGLFIWKFGPVVHPHDTDIAAEEGDE